MTPAEAQAGGAAGTPRTHLAPPGPDEVAAIVAAVDAAWPRPPRVEGAVARPAPRWRFSGRWWTKPIPTRRDRPD